MRNGSILMHVESQGVACYQSWFAISIALVVTGGKVALVSTGLFFCGSLQTPRIVATKKADQMRKSKASKIMGAIDKRSWKLSVGYRTFSLYKVQANLTPKQDQTSSRSCRSRQNMPSPFVDEPFRWFMRNKGQEIRESKRLARGPNHCKYYWQ